MGILYTYLCKQKLNISVIVGFEIRNGPRYTIPPQKLFKIQLNLSTKYTGCFVCWLKQIKAVNRGDKRSRRFRDRDFAKFERSRRYRDRYRCQEKKSLRGRDRDLVFRDPPRRERELDR
jgi:hypothetical protein